MWGLKGAKKGAYLIDMTTSSPALAERIFKEAEALGLHGMDAPVTGGDTGAKAGTLTILAGGRKEDFETVLPVFQAMGKNIRYMGPAGAGQKTKLCNQIAIAGALSGACEALTYAKACGLEVEQVLEAISSGAAGSFQRHEIVPGILRQLRCEPGRTEAGSEGSGEPGRTGTGRCGNPDAAKLLLELVRIMYQNDVSSETSGRCSLAFRAFRLFC